MHAEPTTFRDTPCIHLHAEGASALVAAGALVLPGTKIPPGTLWAGNPAKYKRDLTPDEVKGLETYWQNYIEYKTHYLAET